MITRQIKKTVCACVRACVRAWVCGCLPVCVKWDSTATKSVLFQNSNREFNRATRSTELPGQQSYPVNRATRSTELPGQQSYPVNRATRSTELLGRLMKRTSSCFTCTGAWETDSVEQVNFNLIVSAKYVLHCR